MRRERHHQQCRSAAAPRRRRYRSISSAQRGDAAAPAQPDQRAAGSPCRSPFRSGACRDSGAAGSSARSSPPCTTTPKAAARPRSDGYCTISKISVGMVRMPRGRGQRQRHVEQARTGDEDDQRARQQRRHQQRDRDVPQRVPERGAMHPRRVLERGVHLPHRRDDEQIDVGRVEQRQHPDHAADAVDADEIERNAEQRRASCCSIPLLGAAR